MNYYFLPANDDTFFYAIATELSESDATYYFHLERSQRKSQLYEPPEHPIYRIGTIQQSFSGDWFTSVNASNSTFTGTLDKCKADLIAGPIGAAIDLTKIDDRFMKSLGNRNV